MLITRFKGIPSPTHLPVISMRHPAMAGRHIFAGEFFAASGPDTF